MFWLDVIKVCVLAFKFLLIGLIIFTLFCLIFWVLTTKSTQNIVKEIGSPAASKGRVSSKYKNLAQTTSPMSSPTSSFSDEDLFNIDSHSDSSDTEELHSPQIPFEDLDPDMNIDVDDMFAPKDRFDIHSIRKYNVFLSFRGKDTRASFTSHLSTSLQSSGIIVFKDDHSLQRGHRISKTLLQAIQESRISVVVFSKNYADSQWCLQELMQIMECFRTTRQVVLPVFYDVHPSEVRSQTGDFGKAFRNLLNRVLKVDEFMVPKWRDALRNAAGIAGFVVLNSRLLLSLHFHMLCRLFCAFKSMVLFRISNLCIATSSNVIHYLPF